MKWKIWFYDEEETICTCVTIFLPTLSEGVLTVYDEKGLLFIFPPNRWIQVERIDS